jgi:hypothetical protein
MGLEKACEARFRGATAEVRAHLEPAELRLRGGLRLEVPVAAMKSAEAKAGVLKIAWAKGTLELALGKDAEVWALKIRYPRSRLDKLGIKPGMKVAVQGLEDSGFLKELRDRTDAITVGPPKAGTEAVVVALSRKADLPKLAAARKRIVANGMIWAIWPKGRREFREDDVRAYGPTAGLVDVKVMSFSDTLSGLKLVVPVKDR